jgi:hypothetical protein
LIQKEVMPNVFALNPALTAGAVGLSIVMLLGSLALTPWILVRLPRDYFTSAHHVPLQGFQNRPVLRILLLIVKNLTGLILLLAGISMLILPGQGVLTVFLALLVLDFPGKFRLKRRLFQRPHIRTWINNFRIRHQCEPFE